MKHAPIIKKIIIAALASLALLLFVVPALADSITQGYSSDVSVERGMIVGLTKDDLSKIVPINSSEITRMLGVVVAPNDSAVLLGSNSQTDYVASSGRYSVLVSDQNGNINIGDYIAPSSVSGIGAKTTDDDSMVLGKALEAFKSSDSSQVTGTAQIKDSNGKQHQINLGYVLVDISIGRNPMIKTQDDLPGILRRASQNVTGKSVSAARVYISLVMLAITTLIAGSLIYSGVRGSMIAIGRNPLSRKSIVRGLFQVVLIGLMVFLSGMFGVYLILRL